MTDCAQLESEHKSPISRIRVRTSDGDIVGHPDAPQVYEGTRLTQDINGELFPGTCTRVSPRSVRIVYDDGLTLTGTFRKDVGPCLPGPGSWTVHPWTKREARS